MSATRLRYKDSPKAVLELANRTQSKCTHRYLINPQRKKMIKIKSKNHQEMGLVAHFVNFNSKLTKQKKVTNQSKLSIKIQIIVWLKRITWARRAIKRAIIKKLFHLIINRTSISEIMTFSTKIKTKRRLLKRTNPRKLTIRILKSYWRGEWVKGQKEKH